MHIRKYLLFIFFVSLPPLLNAQIKTDFEKLSLFQEELLQKKQQNYLQAFFKHHTILTKQDNKHLHHFSTTGRPIYYENRSNLSTAQSLGTSQLWTGGNLSLEVNGQNMETSDGFAYLGVWEIGSIRTGHQEFANRITYRDGTSFPSNFSADDLHATHIAGTMIASGTTENARGMAWQATLSAYSDVDDVIEMAEAASQGMLISNHAYGPVFPSVPNYWFRGFYDGEAANWDEVCYLAPFYLPVNACGNDRNESSNLKYDLLLGLSTAKNPLMVGSISVNSSTITQASDIQIADESSFGPTDDGRIKPDIVAPGEGIISTNNLNDGGYSSLSGTSMASAAVSGSLLLLQQYYHSLHNAFLRAATLKALVIHTAYEAGTAIGPDYGYGWGMLNMEEAVQVIQTTQESSLILETVLEQDKTFTYPVMSTGEDVLKITLCWTDAPAEPLPENSASLNDRTSRLMNDLDLRLLDSEGNEIALPWKLDPENPENPATKGDNTVDVVEQIVLENLQEQMYTLQVSHKGVLKDEDGLEKDEQAFSLVITGIDIKITSVENLSTNAELFVYPNPTSADIFFENVEEYSYLQVIDTQGKMVAEHNLKNNLNQINIAHLMSGIYYLNFIGNDKSASHPIIKY